MIFIGVVLGCLVCDFFSLFFQSRFFQRFKVTSEICSVGYYKYNELL